MGLIDRIKARREVFIWRVRYWWLDTPGGARAQVATFCLAILVVVLQLIRAAVEALAPTPQEPVQAIYWWVVQLIIAIVAAVIAYAARPKPQAPTPVEGKAPVTEDGLAVPDHFGTCWVQDEFELAWKVTGRTPIYSKGGKK